MEPATDPATSRKPTVSGTVGYFKDLMAAGPGGVAGRGVEIGVGALLGRTFLKRLPTPLNLVAPLLVEKVIMKYGAEEGRELLLKGLYWVKNATEDKPVQPA
ncbi:hypothetical protein [Dyadobacter fermentans]|uniref:Uncharacterized protein n=1 Tax=Dyadobacter fermentans (strain ATCC 700827 / DSM 18053 / CIP 107007 / KCTC 52180 / NS114) TaxID=471854 RepID=C6W3J0_DYAFD|nr:hypothetical protein [Dyadobacter fermentans]ACT93967.1 hypothetical protein Dfer_2752 [Dyadobacter fermentans DSM 18053]